MKARILKKLQSIIEERGPIVYSDAERVADEIVTALLGRATPKDTLRGWISLYLISHPPGMRSDERIQNRLPLFIEGHSYLFLDHFAEWLKTQGCEGHNTKHLGTIWRASFRLKSKTISAGTSTRSVWPVPSVEVL